MRPHAAKVFAGEYDAPVNFLTPPDILDLGSNVGAFTLWAASRWPGAKIMAYEPHPDNAAAWSINCAELLHSNHASLTQAAVTDRDGEADLHDGVNNCGEASVVFHHATTVRKVRTVAAQQLSTCQVLKLDTEGCESMILKHYPHVVGCPLILLEFHSIPDRNAISRLLEPSHRLCELKNWRPNTGVMKWMKR